MNDISANFEERKMSSLKREDVPSRKVGGVPFVYRELGQSSGVPVIFAN